MKRKCLIIPVIATSILLGACGATVDLNTPKSSELSSEYTYYQDSVNSLRSAMGITPEESDEVFIILSSCGVDDKITQVYKNGSGSDTYYTVWYGLKSLDVYLNGSAVSKVLSSGKEIYPTDSTASDSVTPADSTEVDFEMQVKSELQESIDYYNSVVVDEIPLYASKKDEEKVISLLNEAKERLDCDTDKYLSYMSDDRLSSDMQDACMYVKTAFYGISSTAISPMLDVFNGVSSDSPEYGELVINAQTEYIDKAEKLIK